MKFIHTSDIHLDSPLTGLSSYADVSLEMLRIAPQDAFTNLITAAAGQSGSVEKAKINPELLAHGIPLEELRESNRQQAVHIYFELRAFGYKAVPKDEPRQTIAGFSPEQLKPLAIMEHNRWVAERSVAGWIFGESSDKPRRINANLVSSEQLTESTKDYDREPVRLIPVLLDSVGQNLCRNLPA